VLHVVIQTGSGVAAVIGDHMAHAGAFEHHLLLSRDTSCQIGDHLERQATSVTELPLGLLPQIRRLRGAALALEPDIIHAHSSFAGALVRLSLGTRWQPRIVYTPHGYSFERTDVGRALNRAFRLAEAALSFRGGQVAACSPQEATLARSLPGRQRVTYVPNVAPGPYGNRLSAPHPGAGAIPPVIEVSTAGRVTAARAPWLFAEAALRSGDEAARSHAPTGTIHWVWIGGGDEADEQLLRGAGIEVTGWLAREDALRRMARSHLYVHTASWDGAPMTVLEAAAARVPVLARRTGAMEALGVEPLFDSVRELLDLVAEFPDGPAISAAHRCGETLRQNHTALAQGRALEEIYSRAVQLELPSHRPTTRRMSRPAGNRD